MNIRSYASEPARRGRQDWDGQADARDAVYANRRPIKRERGTRLLRHRGEKLERTFAYCYETGGMRRVHLRGRDNIAKRALIRAAGFNIGQLMRVSYGMRKPRSGSGVVCALVSAPIHAVRRLRAAVGTITTAGRHLAAIFRRSPATLAA